MKMDDKYMDESFKKASGEVKATYHESFWKEVESQLADDSMDNAFKSAAGKTMFVPPMPELASDLDDVFLDDAFRSAGSSASVTYQPEFWQQFQDNLAAIQQDEAFVSAANAVTADYRPHYWNEADMALQEEGLHYEYNKAYWNEARVLLDQADRRIFFLKWSAVAAILLMLSFGGVYTGTQEQTAFRNSLAHATAGNLNRPSSSLPGNGTTVMNNTNSPVVVENSNATINNDAAFSNTPVSNGPQYGTNRDRADQQLSENTPDNLRSSDGATDGSFITDATNDPTDLNNAGALLVNGMEPNALLNTAVDGTPNADVSLSEDESALNFPMSKLPLTDERAIPSVVSASGYDGELVEIRKNAYLNPTHTVAVFGQGGIGNSYGEAEFTPAWRSMWGFDYTNTSYGRLRNFEFGAALAITHVRQNNLGAEEHKESFTYAGNKDNYWWKVQLKDMLYGNVTATVAYRLTSRHKLKLTFGYDHLIFVQSNMAYRNQPNQAIQTVNNNWGVKNGISRSDYRLGLGYEFQASNRFAFQLQGSYGLMDRTDNAFFNNTVYDHEINITAGIKYTLFRKL